MIDIVDKAKLRALLERVAHEAADIVDTGFLGTETRAAMIAEIIDYATGARFERFPRNLWPDGPGGGPYTAQEVAAQLEHTAKWREQEKDCTCSWRSGDWLHRGHVAGCARLGVSNG